MIRTSDMTEVDYQLKMLENLETMNQEKRLCDITIITGDYEYPAHKSILAASSKYFQELLESNMKETSVGNIRLMDVDPECAKSCLDFVYSGKLIIPQDKFYELAHAARLMKIADVTFVLKELLWRSVRDRSGDFRLEKGRFQQFHDDGEYPIPYNRSSSDEEEKLTAILRFIEDHPNEEKHLFDMVQLVNVSRISQEYLEELLEKNSVVANDPRSCKLLKERVVESRRNRERRSKMSIVMIFHSDEKYFYSYDPVTDEVTKFCGLFPLEPELSLLLWTNIFTSLTTSASFDYILFRMN